jgi:hypothetical protein
MRWSVKASSARRSRASLDGRIPMNAESQSRWAGRNGAKFTDIPFLRAVRAMIEARKGAK